MRQKDGEKVLYFVSMLNTKKDQGYKIKQE